jgi:hypothetical protein
MPLCLCQRAFCSFGASDEDFFSLFQTRAASVCKCANFIADLWKVVAEDSQEIFANCSSCWPGEVMDLNEIFANCSS